MYQSYLLKEQDFTFPLHIQIRYHRYFLLCKECQLINPLQDPYICFEAILKKVEYQQSKKLP